MIWRTDGGIYLGLGVRDDNYCPSGCNVLEIPWQETDNFEFFSRPGNHIDIGPMGCGKTRRRFLVNLYHLTKWSTFVIDPKGELTAWTAKFRSDEGSEVFVFDPFGVIERRYPGMVEELPYLKSRGLNPLAMLEPQSDDFADDAKAIAEALIKNEERDTHWAESARALVAGLIMGLRIIDEKYSLVNLREVLGMAPESLGKYIEEMIINTKSEPAIAAKLNRFTEISPENRELLSVLSTAVTQLDWLDSKPIRRELSGGAFDFSMMKHKTVTVYLVLPPRYLKTHATWLRLLITAALTPLIRNTSTINDVPVLFMLDEFAQLGRLEVIERNMALMRGYGVKLWVALQDLAQLKDCYSRRWESFIANAAIQSFAPQDVTTREYLAKLSGQKHVWLDSYSTTSSSTVTWSGPLINSSSTMGKTHITESVFPEDKLAQMKMGQSVFFEANCKPRRILLPDPSEMPNVCEFLKQAEDFAAKYDVYEKVTI